MHTQEDRVDALTTQLREVTDRIGQLSEVREDLRARLLDELRDEAGEVRTGGITAHGRVVVNVSPTRRFDPEVAALILEPDVIEAASRRTLDGAVVKRMVAPALYEACQKVTGYTVRPAGVS